MIIIILTVMITKIKIYFEESHDNDHKKSLKPCHANNHPDSADHQEIFLVAFFGMEYLVRLWAAGCRFGRSSRKDYKYIEQLQCPTFNQL